MKKLTILLTALLLIGSLAAQHHGNHNHNPHGSFPPPPQAPSILVQAQNHETFQVYIDGDRVNNVPNSEVLANNLDSRLHEVVVILAHPAHKAAVTQLYASNPAPIITVSYDMRRQQMLLYSNSQPGFGMNPASPTPPTPQVASDQWVDQMVAIIKGQSFDSEKLSTAKGLLTSGQLFTASQIACIAKELGFSSSQTDFLKAAFPYCADPQNYEIALAVLTFSSDREAVRTFINTQR
ncbi:MAG: DUF4476 domain-containing protein [Bacteroidales bacterium]|nr:DUF4476 domain-containing protein [Bacteroidales bacterium]